jgi:glycerophosphoryl diester phosphodiesterase
LPLIALVVGFGPSPALENGLDDIATYAVGVGPNDGFVSATLVAAADARCLGVHPYTVNDPAEMATLVATGVSGMFTNVPDLLDDVLGGRASKPKRAARRAAKQHRTCVPSG